MQGVCVFCGLPAAWNDSLTAMTETTTTATTTTTTTAKGGGCGCSLSNLKSEMYPMSGGKTGKAVGRDGEKGWKGFSEEDLRGMIPRHALRKWKKKNKRNALMRVKPGSTEGNRYWECRHTMCKVMIKCKGAKVYVEGTDGFVHSPECLKATGAGMRTVMGPQTPSEFVWSRK